MRRTERETPSTRPRVALVAHGVHDRGGMERACAELIRRGHDGFDFCVVSTELAPELQQLVHCWIRIRVPSRPFPLKFAIFWLRAGRAMRRVDTDLTHTVGAIVPNRVDLASIHFCHAGFVAANGRLAPRRAPFLRRLNTTLSRMLALSAERWSYRPTRLRRFGAVSEQVANELALHYPMVACSVTPNGVDLTRFHPNTEAGLAFRREMDTNDGTTVALFVGGDWHRKGLQVAIAAIAVARKADCDIDLWVVGPGDRARFERLAAEQGVASHVRFHGARGDTERFYQAADLFVLPSSYEAFSLACLEAAACRLPLVVPPVSGSEEIVGADAGGLIVERSASSVAAALQRLAADPGLRSFLGEEAYRRVQPYTWERSAASVTKLYGELSESA